MIVTCPKCEARYAVDPLAIGPSGRTVQCARCDNRWFQRVEGPPPPPDLVIRPPTRESTSLPVPVTARPEAGSGWKVLATIVGLVLLAGVALGVYVLRDKMPAPIRSAIYTYGHMAHVQYDRLVALLPRELPSLPSFSSSKETPAPPPPARAAAPVTTPPAATPPAATPPPAVAATTPPAATAPATTPPGAVSPATSSGASSGTTAPPRTEAPATPAQLEVDLSASKIELVDGKYVVKGEIVNHGGTAGAPTKLTVQYKKGNEVLISRTYPLALGPVPPGDRQTFSQVLDNPPAGATDIVPSVE